MAGEPIRTCVGCRQQAAKSDLVRVVAGLDHEGQQVVVLDPSGSAPGRGAHLHPRPECLALAVRRHAFARALRTEVRTDPGLEQQLMSTR